MRARSWTPPTTSGSRTSIEEPTDAILGVVRACISGSDLWPSNDIAGR
jgi:threonine dehydrogenase-like Zn-dependent dehydrogenase